MPLMRAKMKVTNVQGNDDGQTLNLSAVCKNAPYEDDGADEDNTYAMFTPSADVSMYINNPALAGKFEIGQTFYVDFTEVDVE